MRYFEESAEQRILMGLKGPVAPYRPVAPMVSPVTAPGRVEWKSPDTLSNEEYHSRPEISKSRLDRIHKSIAHETQAAPQEENSAMRLGSALHHFVLENDAFSVNYATVNVKSRAAKMYKETVLENPNKTVILELELTQIQYMADAITAHPFASTMLSGGGKAEYSYFWTDPQTGIRCKIRLDYIQDGWINDLKSTQDASPTEFAKSAFNYRYHVQDAFYSDGFEATTGNKPNGFRFVCVEKTAPYNVAVYELDANAKQLGREAYRADLDKWARHIENPVEWQGYPAEVQILSLPPWAFNKF